MCLFYFAYGLCIRSNIPLRGLSPLECTSDVQVDVEVQRVAFPPIPEDSLNQHQADLKPDSALLFWKNVGKFQVRQGREIIIEPEKDVADDLLRPFLLGAALPVLLLQRGLFVLHASAVALRPDGADEAERALVFMGHSGQGKSTMAKALNRRGHRVLADDTVALPFSKHEVPFVYPTIPHLKLRAPSIEAFGEKLADLSRWNLDDDSFVLPLSPPHNHRPAPLRCFYVLEDSISLKVERLPLPEALMSLMQHSYSMGLLPDSELGHSFEVCVQLVQDVPLFKLSRPRDFEHLPDVVRLVEEHQNSLARDSNLNIC